MRFFLYLISLILFFQFFVSAIFSNSIVYYSRQYDDLQKQKSLLQTEIDSNKEIFYRNSSYQGFLTITPSTPFSPINQTLDLTNP